MERPCECCLKTHLSEMSARNCERIHEELQDHYWDLYVDRKEREKLWLASKHPDQKKL